MSNSGQSLVLFALALPVLFSMCALVLDGTNVMVDKRQLQNAADASALAAAQELAPASAAAEACGGTAECLETVRYTNAPTIAAAAADYSDRNGGPASVHECTGAGDTNCYAWPYNGTYDKVEVRVRRSFSGLFAHVTGLDKAVEVGARAVASTTPVESVTPDAVIPGKPAETITAYAVAQDDEAVAEEAVTIPATPDVTIPGETYTTETTYGLDE